MILLLLHISFCTIILLLGVRKYQKSDSKLALFVGIAFGIFGLSDLLVMYFPKKTLQGFLTAIHILAYLVVIWGFFKHEKI